LYASLIGFQPRWLKGLQVIMSSLETDLGLCGYLLHFRLHGMTLLWSTKWVRRKTISQLRDETLCFPIITRLWRARFIPGYT